MVYVPVPHIPGKVDGNGCPRFRSFSGMFGRKKPAESAELTPEQKMFMYTGMAVKNMQALEANLGLMMWYHTVLNGLRSGSGRENYEKYAEKADRLAEEISAMTMGDVLRTVRGTDLMKKSDLRDLSSLLGDRNTIVHRMYRTEIGESEIEEKIAFLSKTIESADRINSILVSIISDLENIYENTEI